jgi:YidC/Oxa1 family membrane protein insertase
MDKRTFLAFVLIAAVIILTPWYYQIISPEPPPGAGTTVDTLATRSRDTTITLAPNVNDTEQVMEKAVQPEKIPEVRIRVQTPLYDATLSTRNGGSFTSFYLKKYTILDSVLVNLVDDENKNNLQVRFISNDGEPTALGGPWQLLNPDTEFIVLDASQELRFQTQYAGATVTKSLTFHPDDYRIEVRLDLTGIRDELSQGTYVLAWDGGLPTTEQNSKDDYAYFNAYVYQGGEQHSPKASKSREEMNVEQVVGKTDWVAIRTKYFVAALIPQNQPAVGALLSGYQKGLQKVFSVGLQQEARLANNTLLYLGPLEYKRVKSIGVNLDHILSFGTIIRPISKGVHFLLTWMHNYIPNYGVVLIIFSILIKIVVYPLTKKSYESTRKMQAIQPLLTEIKEKYKNDQKRLSQAQMKLFKEHGVNPLGGCLPVLLQMPLLFALFRVFRSTIELRGAPFVWWIKDLSSPDTILQLPFTIPIYGDHVAVLPIIMGITMFIQQKMMPTQASGQQKFMSYFMTGFFLLLFNQFPSGLNLYYTLFNVLTILQQKLLTPAPTVAVAPTKSKK